MNRDIKQAVAIAERLGWVLQEFDDKSATVFCSEKNFADLKRRFDDLNDNVKAKCNAIVRIQFKRTSYYRGFVNFFFGK